VNADTKAVRTLSRRVRELRLKKRWTQEKLAEKAYIATAYLSGVERGVRNPTTRVVARIAAALKVPIGKLFETS